MIVNNESSSSREVYENWNFFTEVRGCIFRVEDSCKKELFGVVFADSLH
jgi:hypothetical protein